MKIMRTPICDLNKKSTADLDYLLEIISEVQEKKTPKSDYQKGFLAALSAIKVIIEDRKTPDFNSSLKLKL